MLSISLVMTLTNTSSIEAGCHSFTFNYFSFEIYLKFKKCRKNNYALF